MPAQHGNVIAGQAAAPQHHGHGFGENFGKGEEQGNHTQHTQTDK